jgi:hypothetical protein
MLKRSCKFGMNLTSGCIPRSQSVLLSNHDVCVCDRITSLLNTARKARGGQSALQQTLKGLSNDAGTKDLLEAARKLSKKAKVWSSNLLRNV